MKLGEATPDNNLIGGKGNVNNKLHKRLWKFKIQIRPWLFKFKFLSGHFSDFIAGYGHETSSKFDFLEKE